MTDWQWKVIVAMCKLLIKIVNGDEIYCQDKDLIREAINRTPDND